MKSTTWNEFEYFLLSNGVALNLCLDKKGKIKGVAYEKDGFSISSSKLGSHGAFIYELNYLNQIIDKNTFEV